MTEAGSVYSEQKNGFEKTGYWYHCDDIRRDSDEIFERELADCVKVSVVEAIIEEVEVAAEESLEFPPIYEIANNDILPTEIKEGKIFSGDTQEVEFEETWKSIYSLFSDQTLLKKDLSIKDAFEWLEKNYNVPTKKQ